MELTSLQRTSSEHVTVCLEDGSEIRSTAGVVAEMMLYSGKDLDEEAVERLWELSEQALLQEKAISLLSYSRMSSRELRNKLIRKGADPDAAEAVTERLLELRLLDDEEYAAAVVRHYAAKGYGAGRIRAELSRRGIDRELREEAMESAPPPDKRIDRILQAKLKDPEDRDEVRKVTASLFRRGYSWDEIRSALTRYSDQS